MRVLVLLAAAALAEAGTAEGMEALKAQDYAKAKEEFRTAADAGDAEAQFQLGELYLNGLGVTKSPRYAVQWYEKAVAQGLAGCSALERCRYVQEPRTRTRAAAVRR